MEELTIEQKAERYNEAIRRGLDFIRHTPVDKMVTRQDIFEAIFPEFKESEDEKIRKALISVLKSDFENDNTIYGISVGDIISWLEKQGESDETKAKMFLMSKGYPIDTNGTFPTYEEMYNIIKDGLEKQDEQKPAEWSEEDERLFQIIIDILDRENHLGHISHADLIACVKKLKSLRPQPKQEWKPTEKQMEALDYYANSLCTYCDRQDDIRSLYNDLKKL